jgi:hypothetical protein
MLVLETKHEGISAMQSAATRHHNQYVNPASLAQLNSWTKYIYMHIPKKEESQERTGNRPVSCHCQQLQVQ